MVTLRQLLLTLLLNWLAHVCCAISFERYYTYRLSGKNWHITVKSWRNVVQIWLCASRQICYHIREILSWMTLKWLVVLAQIARWHLSPIANGYFLGNLMPVLSASCVVVSHRWRMKLRMTTKYIRFHKARINSYDPFHWQKEFRNYHLLFYFKS